ncbi:cell division regulator GpsB [Holzapfeliella sp. He02]|uniref:Cell division regulator GpsB n=1 Tax=Holzapfeliella saturejae TaxID=3082953 RepID=A0ABU8SGU2_9LACO
MEDKNKARYEGIQFSVYDILEKQFSQARKGYDSDEVNDFLDKIIEDYQVYNQKIETLSQKVDQLQTQKAELEAKNRENNYSDGLETPASTNFDILKRLSKLESQVYQLQQQQSQENHSFSNNQ